MNSIYCNNCGKPGHIYSQCKVPVTSYGVVCFRYNSEKKQYEYLMICRKDTLGYIDFMRGKYLVQNKHYILNMIKQMTLQEREKMLSRSFDDLWVELWGDNGSINKYKTEEIASREKFNLLKTGILNKNEFFTLDSMVREANSINLWNDPEWGFPKGRRNYQEKDFECAMREFCEETGYNKSLLTNIQNVLPYEEIFIGSNYKSYKHKYYLMYMNYHQSLTPTSYEENEVSKIEWKSFDSCVKNIRCYNLEKKRMITNIHTMLQNYNIMHS